MVTIFVRRIQEDKMKLEEVPTLWRSRVQEELNK